jgi:glycosyltransferase involved in cell wall biosynthesis
MFISGQLIVRERTEFGGRLVSACLESLRGFLDEVIIVNNGCSEEVHGMIMSQMKEWPTEYTFVMHGEDADFSTLRNFALANMCPKADWVFQFDSDDIFWPEKLVLVKDKMRQVRECCLYGHFYHLMEVPFIYQGMYKHRHLYPVSPCMGWEKAVHEKLMGVHEKEEDSGLVWTHWGYTRSVIATAIKWVHYQVLEKGNADCYKQDCLFSGRGIEHILDDRQPLCTPYKEKFPPAAQKWLVDGYNASHSHTWQDWVTGELDPQFKNMLRDFKKIAWGDKIGHIRPGFWQGVIDYIVKEKLWEQI